jgi:hypothetical protein
MFVLNPGLPLRNGVSWILNRKRDTYEGYVVRAFTSLVFLEKFITSSAARISDYVLEP